MLNHSYTHKNKIPENPKDNCVHIIIIITVIKAAAFLIENKSRPLSLLQAYKSTFLLHEYYLLYIDSILNIQKKKYYKGSIKCWWVVAIT